MHLFKKYLARFFLTLIGWKAEGQAPKLDKYVFICAPHTANFDGVLLVAFCMLYGISVKWLTKDSIFKPPFGWFLRQIGAIPINRKSPHNVVQQMALLFQQNKKLILAVPPEGTRKYTDHWKSGFYFIAKEAGVPISLAFIDYKRKRGGFGPLLYTSDNVKADMDKIRDFYKDKQGCHPENFSRIYLKSESDPV